MSPADHDNRLREIATQIGEAADDPFVDWQLDLVVPVLRSALAPILDKADSADRMAGEVQAAQEMRKRLDRRIHCQRLALQHNWQIVEIRMGIAARSRLYRLLRKRHHAIRAAEARADRLSAEVEARDKRIAVLSETWTDENGTVWSPPTAWAYAKACAALHKHRAEVEAARAILADVIAWIDTYLPAGTPRAGIVHAAISRALARAAVKAETEGSDQ